MHLLVCYLNKLQNARCNDKDSSVCTFNFYYIKRSVCVTELESVSCAVRTESLYEAETFRLKRVKLLLHKFPKSCTYVSSAVPLITECLSQRNTLRTPTVRRILNNVPLHNTTCCHSTLLIQGIN